MCTRRNFLIQSGLLLGGALLPACARKTDTPSHLLGIQLYTFRDAMLEDAEGTLELIAGLGIKEIETARSDKGNYYGLGPAGMRDACRNLGMTLRSGHVLLDENWQRTVAEAAEAEQEYLICSSMPSEGQTVANYQRVADAFNQAGEECRSLGIHFGYHNHAYEFEAENGQVLYDVLMDHTDPELVHMELDLGWVIVGGQDPIDYFDRYPGRFPLWHLKDMNVAEGVSTEFGKGGLDIPKMLEAAGKSGMRYSFTEQEDYASTPLESMRHNMDYLNDLEH